MRRSTDERGFTLVEIMVAMVVLLVGVLGTVKLIDSANATTVKTRARETANNLAREIVENARVVDYDTLTAADVEPALQEKPSLADSTPSTSVWTVDRGNKTYTVTATACTYDDAKDSVATAHNSSFCSNTPTVTPATDVNPDDFRRVDLTITWPLRGATGTVRQSVLIINPSGGLGPRIVTFLPNGSTTPSITITNAATTSVPFTVTSSFAASVNWAADDSVSSGQANGGPSTWTFSWSLGQALDTNAPYRRDGTYELTAQAIDTVGIPGDLRSVVVTVNRSLAQAPTGVAGGRNDRFAGGPTGQIVDIDWEPNKERDIRGYRVYRAGPDGEVDTDDDVLVCPASGGELAETACADTNPPPTATRYYVRALDTDAGSTNVRPGTLSAVIDVPASATDRPTFADGTALDVSVVGGKPTLSWDPAADSDGTISFYRIYRDTGAGFGGRYDRTETSSPNYTDPAPGASTTHTYWVTAVDDSYNESDPIGPVTSP
ncbi:MAG: prepilin-type N-terminal cleavage/methylation domain-containing protein [Actinomycetota bacterium]|nr:prepilin-type N-terminal cleavage/methylation domain-containing protein [Actinomycetota bacterium]